MTSQELRQLVVKTAEGWMGKKESNGSHKVIIDLYNSHKPLARGYKVKYADAWCATFVSAVAIKTNLTNIIPTECSCNQMIALFKKLGSWVENDAYVPSIGDILFYDWDDNGKGDNIGSVEHVGIVTTCDGKNITVIEGNKNDAVGKRQMQVNGQYIRGYGVPKYESMADKTQAEKEDDKDMTGEEIYKKLVEYLSSQSAPEWAKSELAEAHELGITDGTRPMMFASRLESAIMAKRAAKVAKQK